MVQLSGGSSQVTVWIFPPQRDRHDTNAAFEGCRARESALRQNDARPLMRSRVVSVQCPAAGPESASPFPPHRQTPVLQIPEMHWFPLVQVVPVGPFARHRPDPLQKNEPLRQSVSTLQVVLQALLAHE